MITTPAPQITVKRAKRRSKRLGLSVAVFVHGKDVSGQAFRESTRTLAVNANGALLALTGEVEEGQSILVENKNTRKEQECRVVHVGPPQDGKSSVGVAFIHPAPGFWGIYFPPTVGR